VNLQGYLRVFNLFSLELPPEMLAIFIPEIACIHFFLSITQTKKGLPHMTILKILFSKIFYFYI